MEKEGGRDRPSLYSKDPQQAGVKLADFIFRRVIGRGTYGKVFLIERR
jgi:hypothetical protein